MPGTLIIEGMLIIPRRSTDTDMIFLGCTGRLPSLADNIKLRIIVYNYMQWFSCAYLFSSYWGMQGLQNDCGKSEWWLGAMECSGRRQ